MAFDLETGGGEGIETHRISDAVCRPLEIHIDAARPELTSGVLELEDLGGLGTEDFTTFLAGMLIKVAFVRRRRPTSLLGRSGRSYFLEMVYMCLDVVNVPEDCSPVSG